MAIAKIRSSLDDETLAARVAVGDKDAEAELCGRHATLAGAIARSFVRRGAPYEDLESVGFLGLLRAVRNYDPARGIKFTAFARMCIRCDLNHYVKSVTSDARRPDEEPLRLGTGEDELDAMAPPELDRDLLLDLERLLAEACQDLSERHRRFVLRVCVLGEQMAAVAKDEGVSRQAVGQALERVRERVWQRGGWELVAG